MHKLIEKITSVLTAFTLVGLNFIPAIVYAANEISNLSTDENLLFDANINNSTSYTASIDEQLSLNINLSVVGDGYIKSGTIRIENNNYKLGETEENNEIERVDDNIFELSQISDKDSVNLSIPIMFEKNGLTDIDYFEKDSSIQLDANYINENGEEEKISRKIVNHLKWDNKVEGSLSQELKRYLKYENKTLISFLVSSGIRDNTMPITEKTIQILAPLVNNIEPNKVIVSGDDISYSYQNQVVLISKNYVSENKVQWNSNDEYLVTYIYDTQVEETDIETLAVMLAKTVSKNNIEIRTENFSYHIKDNVGNLIETTIGGDNEINKGYMYTNLNRKDNKLETTYNSVYQVNVGLSDFIDEIEIMEFPSNYETIDKNIYVDKDNLVEILGENGTIRVLDQKNIELGILNKDNLQLEVNQFGLKFYSSKPIKEGNLNIFINKAINPNLVYKIENLSNTSYIENSIDVVGRLQGQEVSYNNVIKKIELIEPQSNATITISNENLSTVMKNENVIITATLEKNDIADALYTNPEILITLPNQISNVFLKDAKLIYEDELVPVDFRMVGKQIYLKLEGTQTEYSLVPNANGTVVRIVVDMTLDNLAVNANEKITMQYTNMARNELKTIETPINIVAPTGFITSNEGTLSQSISAITKDETIEIAANDREKQLKLSGTVVSNLKDNAKGLVILGRIPSQNTVKTDVSNENLNSTFTTNMISNISVGGIDADIYYSDNGNATYELDKSENEWELEARETSRSYLIVPKSEVTPAQKITFSYNIKVPRNIDYENNAVSQYAVYYDNDAENGTSKNIILSKDINIATENIPIIRTEILAEDYNTGEKIENGSSVNSGKLVKYIIRSTNTGKKAAQNVKVKIERPENTVFYIEEYIKDLEYYNNHYDNSLVIEKNIEKIEAGQTIDIEAIVKLDYSIDEGAILTARAEITAENMFENSTASFENSAKEGTLELNIYTTNLDEDVRINDEITYNISLENYKKEALNNIEIKVNIPKYIEILETSDGKFDKESRTLTYNIDQLKNYKYLNFKGKVVSSDEPNQEITIKATATFDEMEKEVKSNTFTKTILDTKGFTATLSSNIVGKMFDTDRIEYYLTIRNDSKKSALLNIFDELPKELRLQSYTVKNGSKGYTKEDANLDTSIVETINAGDSIKVTIIAKPYLLGRAGETIEIENKVNVKVNGIDLKVNTIKHEIEGTAIFNSEITENMQETKNNIFSISGKVWYDENSNSKRDENEVGIPKVSLKLFDLNDKSLLKDSKGNVLELYTNDNGEYKFENLYSGRYIVIASYDNEVYKLANYQVGEFSSNENSDFIESNGQDAITNTITLNEENIYNIDLGLSDVQNFSMVLNSNITKINVISKDGNKTYDFNKDKVTLNINKVENTTLVIEYLIEVVNEGNIEGYANKIETTIPKGMEFISELNQSWYIDNAGNAVNTSISNKLIKSGEKENLKLVLVKNIEKQQNQMIHSTIEIKNTSNQYGIEETKNSLSERKIKSADIIITNKNSNILIRLLAVSLGIITLIVIISIKWINRK